jgi:hypothetical protein
MDLKIEELLVTMLNIAKGKFGAAYEDAKDFAEVEFKKLLENTEFLAKKVASGEMTAERAKRHLRMSKNAAEAVLLTVEGIGLDAAEEAIEDALNAVKSTVNAALPISIL